MHLRCEHCGGPENWCLDINDDVWVRCMDDSCVARTNLELWPEEPIWPEGVVTDMRGPESIDECAQDQVRTHPKDGLPF